MFKSLKAVAVAVAVMSSSVFASWDYFPPKDAGQGEVKVGFEYQIDPVKFSDDRIAAMELGVGARYTIIEGLEASLWLPIPLSLTIDGDAPSYCEAWDDNYDYCIRRKEIGTAGLGSPVIGLRYWLPIGLGFFADITLPIDTREIAEDDYNGEAMLLGAMKLGVGAQYSMQINEELSFGSQVGLIIPFAKELEWSGNGWKETAEITEGMELHVGVELRYSLGMVTPYFGLDMLMGLTKMEGEYSYVDFEGGYSDSGKWEADDPAKLAVGFTIGADFDINDNFTIGAFFGIGFGERYEYYEWDYNPNTGEERRKTESYSPMTIGLNASFNF